MAMGREPTPVDGLCIVAASLFFLSRLVWEHGMGIYEKDLLGTRERIFASLVY